jgi:hypothetical protein
MFDQNNNQAISPVFANASNSKKKIVFDAEDNEDDDEDEFLSFKKNKKRKAVLDDQDEVLLVLSSDESQNKENENQNEPKTSVKRKRVASPRESTQIVVEKTNKTTSRFGQDITSKINNTNNRASSKKQVDGNNNKIKKILSNDQVASYQTPVEGDNYDLEDSFIDDEKDENSEDDESLTEINDDDDDDEVDDDFNEGQESQGTETHLPIGYDIDNIDEDLDFQNELRDIEKMPQDREDFEKANPKFKKKQPEPPLIVINHPIDTAGNGQNNQLQQQLQHQQQLQQQLQLQQQQRQQQQLLDLEDLDEEELVPLITYLPYKPKKFKLGCHHPDLVVETTSLASVEPPAVSYQLKLPERVIKKRMLSALQLEAVVYACQSHQFILGNGQRKGFLLGDGAGVGKGRTIAGIIYENFLNLRSKAIWISISSDLELDAERDMRDVGIDMSSFRIANLKDISDYRPINKRTGVLFCTYSSLIAKKRAPKLGEFDTRLAQIKNWCGPNFDGVIVFDESHKAKNLFPEKGKPTQTGKAVLQLQDALPNARIVYASATGASNCKHMAYMSRLGLWGSDDSPFRTLPEFTDFISESGVTAMEVVSLDLKWQGIFLARQLSFAGATFEIKEIELDQRIVSIYDRSVQLWVKILNYCNDFKRISSVAKDLFLKYWSSHQRFFRYMCIASKIDETVRICKEAIRDNKCVVIGLQTTGESQSLKSNTKNVSMNSIPSNIYGSLSDVVKDLPNIHVVDNREHHHQEEGDGTFQPDVNEAANTIRVKGANGIVFEMPRQVYIYTLKSNYDEISSELHRLRPLLPGNSLDKLIIDLGGPSKVAEMTGRQVNVVCSRYGEGNADDLTPKKYTLQNRTTSDCDKVNIEEKNKFLSGQKLIAIISDAASSGISLQAHRECGNQRRRLHITLELPWSSDKAIQQFGRTHRSNQTQAPDYLLVISKLAGERRFASSVAKRIETMNAITHADRNATRARDLSCFNIENKFGNKVVKKLVTSLLSSTLIHNVKMDFLHTYSQSEFSINAKSALIGVELTSAANPPLLVNKFLNRLLGCEVEIQNLIFKYFESALETEILTAKREGSFDNGVENIDLTLKEILNKKCETFKLKDHRNIYFHSFNIKDGMSFKEVFAIHEKNKSADKLNGFYYQRYGVHANMPMLAIKSSTGFHKYILYSPLHGMVKYRLYAEELNSDYQKVQIGDDYKTCKKMSRIKTSWTHFYVESNWRYDLHVLSGSILTVFKKVKCLFDGKVNKFQMVKVTNGDEDRIIGVNIPYFFISKLRAIIAELL